MNRKNGEKAGFPSCFKSEQQEYFCFERQSECVVGGAVGQRDQERENLKHAPCPA